MNTPSGSVSISDQCWSMVTLENRSQTIPQHHHRPLASDADTAATARCSYTLNLLRIWLVKMLAYQRLHCCFYNDICCSWLLGSTKYGISLMMKCVQQLRRCVCILQYSTIRDSLSLLVGNTIYYSCMAIL